ncbi:hypothetical protein D9758_003530 [Tetrapyrgos nigripes]|uniref:alpha-1,2-Mannosidase n=1 Tax=Tetrapyrgos nigripes TaxID=182062 RepID=A0A8H5GV50_9AGAR|nr:hypothetical protein D9758_003530 [Tetrapyrgos nigripes]
MSILGANIQKSGLALPSSATANRDRAKTIFTTSYEAYKKHAWGHDELMPVSQNYSDNRNGWGATIVDAMSTMWVMGLDDYLDEAIKFSSQIDFSQSKTNDTVSVFESTIRYVGGLLSTYELTGKQHHALVQKAQQLADKLSKAWIDSDIPYGHMNFTDNTPDPNPDYENVYILCFACMSRADQYFQSNIAEAGTLSLEWYLLTKYTGDYKYRQLTENSVKRVGNNVCLLKESAQSPVSLSEDMSSVPFSIVTWGGGSDSYFEYLIKYARLTNTDDTFYGDTWRTAVDSSIKTLRSVSKTQTIPATGQRKDLGPSSNFNTQVSDVGSHVYLADYDSQRRIRHVGSHLECFHGGNWIMGGRLSDNETIFQHALDLVDACWNTYAGTATGIGPEVFAWKSTGYNGSFTGSNDPSDAQLAFYNEHGFYITSAYYVMRPEVLESNFYAYRATGDPKYLDRAAQALTSFEQYLKTSDSYAMLVNVNDNSSNPENFYDSMESFWFAETLKYLYLTFDDPEHVSLDKYVFNTEAHPFEAPTALSTYGSRTINLGAATQKSQSFTPTKNDADLPAVSPIPALDLSVPIIVNDLVNDVLGGTRDFDFCMIFSIVAELSYAFPLSFPDLAIVVVYRMVRLRLTTALLLALSSSTSTVLGGNIQKSGLSLPSDAKANRDRVKDMFITSYEAYRRYAWGHDELMPMMQNYSDSRNGWGATIIDAMSTMWVMDLDTSRATSTKPFNSLPTSISVNPRLMTAVFESTIRYLGGLLSVYELTGRRHQALVEKSQQLADKLAKAWIESDIPHGHMNFTTDTPDPDPDYDISNIAEAGSRSKKSIAHVGMVSPKQIYGQLEVLAAGPERRKASLPALGIDPYTGVPVGGYVTWGGGSDSYFEYLIKFARLANTDDAWYGDSWRTAVDSSIKHLRSVSDVGNHVYLGSYDHERRLRHVSSHLACFHGGNWIMGGRLSDNETIVQHGLDLTEACWNTYASSVTGIGPEVFAWRSGGVNGSFIGKAKPSHVQLEFYQKHGFYTLFSDYGMRPEVLESNFYAWRATGDRKYIDRAAQTLASFEKYLKFNGSYAMLVNMNDDSGATDNFIDSTESFWFAETLKYLYLTFDDPEHVSLDKYVFNTEAHPFEAPAPLASYGSGTIDLALAEQQSESFMPIMEEDLLPRPITIVVQDIWGSVLGLLSPRFSQKDA